MSDAFEPPRTVAEGIAQRHGLALWHSLVDDISQALEEAHDMGVQRGQILRHSRSGSSSFPRPNGETL